MDMSWKSIVTDSYGILWKMIIRPPRAQYTIQDLGPKRFRIKEEIKNQAFERRDMQIMNDRGMTLECSHYVPLDAPGVKPGPKPCVIYLHGNCSSRLEASDQWQVLLPRGITVFTLDLAGSGLSGGEYISLGFYEERDLRTVIDYLRRSGDVTAIALWGRSMGAATSILRASEDWDIAAIVLDSPFSSLRVVAEELVHMNSGPVTVPDWLVNAALEMVRGEIKTRAHFDIEELTPLKRAPEARSPALFAVASDDDFVLPHHTRKLYEAWGGDGGSVERKLVTFNGGHNGARPQWFLDQAAEFLLERLQAKAAMYRAADNDNSSFIDPQVSFLPWDGIADDVVVLAPPPPEQDLPYGRRQSASSQPPIPAPPTSSSDSRAPAATREPLTRQNATPEGIRAQKLVNMGFSAEMAADAARRHPTVEQAIEWILQQSVQILQESAQTLGRVELRAPAQRTQVTRPVERAAGHTPAPASRSAGQTGADAKTGGYGTTGGSPPAAARPAAGTRPRSNSGANVDAVVKQLRDLGFTTSQANEAARRNSTVEGAVEWILQNP